MIFKGSRLTAQEMVINHPKQANMSVITLAWPPLTALRAFGTGDREVARRFFIAEVTVKTHLVHIYGELGVDPRIGRHRRRHRRWAAVAASAPVSLPACTFGMAGSAPPWSAGRIPVRGGPGSR
ncbi:hypothetical protein ABZ260_37775 [Streptosporangium sp. NPDC006013]|uniref:hypothetical protein n=1 Tax=Streptosporangium sp. NPDC006013 TaxID=3155596 RepID=UPI0033AB81D7